MSSPTSPTVPVPPETCLPTEAPDPLPQILLGETINLLAGAPNTGKTALIAKMAQQFRDQEPIFGRQPGPVAFQGIITADRSWPKSSALWFELSGFPDIPRYALQDDLSFNPSRLRFKRNRMQILEESVERLNPPSGGLIYIDPLAPFLGGNLNDYDACMVACMEIRRLCRSRHITIIGMTHAGKQKNDPKEQYVRLQDRILGSAAQFGYTDTQMYLSSPDELGVPHYTFLWHSHHSPPETFPLVRDAFGMFIPYEEGVQRSELEDNLLGFLPREGDGSPTMDLVRRFGVSRVTLWRALNRLREEGMVEQVGRGRWRKRRVH